MTNGQLARWQDFSLRMARTCYARHRRPYVREIVEQVVDFFDCLDPTDAAKITDWDASPVYVCDMVSDWEREWVPHYWGVLDDEYYWRARDQWAGPATACIRAGLDVASSPSAGVVGFTFGDLARMYPEGVPEWVMAFVLPEGRTELRKDEHVWL